MNSNKIKPGDKVAIIGAGISGLSMAYFLDKKCEVTLFEKENRLGGHARTITIDNYGTKIDVDTGFLNFNKNYPLLLKLFSKLKLDILRSEMSIGMSINDGELEWSGKSFYSLFAQKKNILNIRMWKGLLDIIKFNKLALSTSHEHPEFTLQNLLDALSMGAWFRESYLLPICASLWNTPIQNMLDFPALIFINFFNNHGMLSTDSHVEWYTLKNGSHVYISALRELLNCKIRMNSSIEYIDYSFEEGVVLKHKNEVAKPYTHVIFACHADQALKLIKSPTTLQQELLSCFHYSKNVAFTHNDDSQMPKIRECWSSWNYMHLPDSENKLAITYWMNKLQSIKHDYPIFVTLNPVKPIRPEAIFDKTTYYHPIFDFKSLKAQGALYKLQGENNMWFCGSYFGMGFHEDGIRSSYELAKSWGFKSLL